MTAVKVSYPFTLLNSGISTLIGTGSASVLSRAIGKKDRQTVDKIMGNLIAWVLILSLILSITFFQAIGKGGNAAILTVLRQILLFLPLVLILPHVFTNSVAGVFYAQLVTDAVVLVLAVALMAAAFKSIRSEERPAIA